MFKKFINKLKELDKKDTIKWLLNDTKQFRRIPRTFVFKGSEYKILKWNFKDYYHQSEFSEVTPIIQVTKLINSSEENVKVYDLREAPFSNHKYNYGLQNLSAIVFTDKMYLWEFLELLEKAIDEENFVSSELQIISNNKRR